MATTRKQQGRKTETPPPSNNGWKTCSRGHKYRGAGPCPICWPGGVSKRSTG